MVFDYVEKIGALTDEQRLSFYELLAHDLTVAAREVWSDEELTDAQKVARLEWLNEILHRVTAKSRHLRLGTNTWTEADSYENMRHWVRQDLALAPLVTWAAMRCYRIVTDSAPSV